MTVLTLLVLLVAELTSSATRVTLGDREHLDADSEARLTFDRVGTDIARMVRRMDVDYLFAKETTPSQGTNDKMFFYSEAPGFYDGGNGSNLQVCSSVGLIGYRINAAFQLERLGKLLTWDGTPAGTSSSGLTSPGGIIFLNWPSAALNPDPRTTLTGNWPGTIGSVTDSPPYSGTDPDYHVFADEVFRLEICYLLKPIQLSTGSYQNAAYSGVPVANPSDRTNNLVATGPPKAQNDISGGYIAGSRWYDATNSRAYQCVNNTLNAAVWRPLGVQDLAGIVVAIAVLDSTSSKVIPTTTFTVNGASVVAPNLTSLSGAFADLPQTNAAAANNTIPDLTLTPQRLMAEAWTNELSSSTFAQTAKIPKVAAAQVRIYQHCFPVNGN